MAPHLEQLRQCQIRRDAAKRYHGTDNAEYIRLDEIWIQMFAALPWDEKVAFSTYMENEAPAPVVDVPEEGEAERSI